MSSFPSKHIKKEKQAIDQQYQFKYDETAQASTPRANTPDFSEYAIQRDSSGSSTERERTSSQRRSKRNKGKNKGKEREDIRDEDGPQQQSTHAHNRHEDRPTPTPPTSQMPSSTIVSSRQAAKRDRSSRKHSKDVERIHSDDWSGVTDPEERRRIQNRIAQRKFREKTREQKERNERDLMNQARAGSSYQVPDPASLPDEDSYELSGVPWGGVSLRFMMAKGHESVYANSRGGSGSSAHLASTAATIVPPSPRSVDPAATMTTTTTTPSFEYSVFSGDAGPVAAVGGGSFSSYYGSGGSSTSSGDDGSSSRSSSDFALPDDSQFYDDTSCFYDYEA